MRHSEKLNSELTNGQIWVGRLLTLAGLSKSSSEARRLVVQGGVRLDGEKVVEDVKEVVDNILDESMKQSLDGVDPWMANKMKQ